MMGILITLIWSLHIVYMYQNMTLYPVNIYSYYISTKNGKKLWYLILYISIFSREGQDFFFIHTLYCSIIYCSRKDLRCLGKIYPTLADHLSLFVLFLILGTAKVILQSLFLLQFFTLNEWVTWFDVLVDFKHKW